MNPFEDRIKRMSDDMKDEQDAVQASLEAIAQDIHKKFRLSATLAKAMVDGAMLLLQDYVSERTQVMQTLSGDFSNVPENMRPTEMDKEDARRDGWLLIMRLQNLTAYHARMWTALLPLLVGKDEDHIERAQQALTEAMRSVQALLVENCERVWNESLNTTAADDAQSALLKIMEKAKGGGNGTVH